MKFLPNWISIGLSLFPNWTLASIPTDPIFISERVVGGGNKFNLSFVSYRDYQEIRWDQDLDGSIDVWFASKGDMQIRQTFKKGQLSDILISKRLKNSFLYLKYVALGQNNLKLTAIRILPFRNYYGGMHSREPVSSDQGNHESMSCTKNPFEKAIGSKNWKDMQCLLSNDVRRADIDQAISPSCSSLGGKLKQQLRQAADVVYVSDFSRPIEENKLLNCLANGPSQMSLTLFPAYFEKITNHLHQRKTPEIVCRQIPPGNCGRAEYKSGNDTIEIPISEPPCASNMVPVFAEGIFHEKIHQSVPTFSEDQVKTIIDVCYKNLPNRLSLLEWHDEATDKRSGIDSPAAVTAAADQISQEIKSVIPTSIATGSSSQEFTGSSFGQGLQMLNSGFRSIASVGSPDSGGKWNPLSTLNASLGRTNNLFKTFSFLSNESVAQAAPVAVAAFTELPSQVSAVAGGEVEKRAPASLKLAGKSNATGGSDANSSLKLGNTLATRVPNQQLDSSASIDSPDAPIGSDKVDQLLGEITSVKDKKLQSQLLGQKSKDLREFNIYIFDKRTNTSFGANRNKAIFRYILIDGMLVPE
jgi:hypothetical protein